MGARPGSELVFECFDLYSIIVQNPLDLGRLALMSSLAISEIKIGAELPPWCGPGEVPAQARLVEELGFNRLWFRDMITCNWELWSALGAVAATTNKIRLGVDVTNPFTRSPAATAHAAATIDRISRGRLDLGLGRGIPRLLGALGIEMHAEGLAEAIDIIKLLLEGKTAHYQGKVFRISGLLLPVRPVQDQLPIYIAALEEEGFKLAGEKGCELLTISSSQALLLKARDLASRGKGGPGPRIALWLPYSESRAKLSSYIEGLAGNLPEDFFALAGLKRDKMGKDDLLSIFAICGRQDLERKAKALAGVGVEEIIIEYFDPAELRRLMG